MNDPQTLVQCLSGQSSTLQILLFLKRISWYFMVLLHHMLTFLSAIKVHLWTNEQLYTSSSGWKNLKLYFYVIFSFCCNGIGEKNHLRVTWLCYYNIFILLFSMGIYCILIYCILFSGRIPVRKINTNIAIG